MTPVAPAAPAKDISDEGAAFAASILGDAAPTVVATPDPAQTSAPVLAATPAPQAAPMQSATVAPVA